MTTVFKALSDDTRRQILKLLANGDMTAKEISENFTISKPAISKHLDILKEARLVTSERTGMSVTYSLNASVLQTTLGAFLEFFDTNKSTGKRETRMKLYRSLNMIFLIIFIIGTVLCFKYLPSEVPLFMQSPSRWVFIGICFVLLLALAIAAFFPHKISKSDNEVRNDITLTVINLLGLGIFLFYFITVAKYCGLQMNYMKGIVLIVGGLMVLVGNLLPQMPYRSCIGFKLPWILKDKLCWQKTHRFAGYTAIPFGIIQCLLVLFVQNNNLVFLLGIGIWIITVCIYSLIIFYQNKDRIG